MKKDKLFDVIVYRFLLSIPVSCVANFVYGFALFIAMLVWSHSYNYFEYILVSSATFIPFVSFNIIRYFAIESGHLRYGIVGLIVSSVPEYLFIITWVLLVI